VRITLKYSPTGIQRKSSQSRRGHRKAVITAQAL
jgi:hypothetical protein